MLQGLVIREGCELRWLVTLNVTRRRGLNINNKGGRERHTFDNEHAEQWNQISSWAHNDVNTGSERTGQRKRSCTSFYRWYINNPRTLPFDLSRVRKLYKSDNSWAAHTLLFLGLEIHIFTAHPPLKPSPALVSIPPLVLNCSFIPG